MSLTYLHSRTSPPCTCVCGDNSEVRGRMCAMAMVRCTLDVCTIALVSYRRHDLQVHTILYERHKLPRQEQVTASKISRGGECNEPGTQINQQTGLRFI